MPSGVYVRTEEMKKNMGRYIRTPEIRKKQSDAMKDRKVSDETKRKISKSKKGKHTGEKALWFGKFGKEHPCYKDGSALYSNLHIWLNKNFIKPKNCEICGLPENYDEKHKKLEWSNKTGRLIKNRSNFQYIHRSCHIKYDIKNKIIHERLENKE